MLGAGVPVLDTDQRGAQRGLDHTGEPHRFIALEPGSRNTRSRHLEAEQQGFRTGKREAEGGVRVCSTKDVFWKARKK